MLKNFILFCLSWYNSFQNCLNVSIWFISSCIVFFRFFFLYMLKQFHRFFIPPQLSLSKNSLKDLSLSAFICLCHFFLLVMNLCVLLRILLAKFITNLLLVQMRTSLLKALLMFLRYFLAYVGSLFLDFTAYLFLQLKSTSVSTIQFSQSFMYQLVSIDQISKFSVNCCSFSFSFLAKAYCLLGFAYLILFHSCPIVLCLTTPICLSITKLIGMWSLYTQQLLMTLWFQYVSSRLINVQSMMDLIILDPFYSLLVGSSFEFNIMRSAISVISFIYSPPELLMLLQYPAILALKSPQIAIYLVAITCSTSFHSPWK